MKILCLLTQFVMSRTTAAVAPVFQLYFHNLVMHRVIMADSDLGIDLRRMSHCPETKKEIQKVTHTKLMLIVITLTGVCLMEKSGHTSCACVGSCSGFMEETHLSFLAANQILFF